MIDFSLIDNGPPIPLGYVDLNYGTCGFRGCVDMPKDHLNHVMYRSGLTFTLLPFISRDFMKKYNCTDGKVMMGAMITASHNLSIDNGIKLFTPSGDLIDGDWESILMEIVNYRGDVKLKLNELCHNAALNNITELIILIGQDTRLSCFTLVNHLYMGIINIFKLFNINNINCRILGKVTTPTIPLLLYYKIYDCINDDCYFNNINNFFTNCINTFISGGILPYNMRNKIELFIDCSYGIGGLKIQLYFDLLRRLNIIPYLLNSCIWYNDIESNKLLNKNCGAQYIISTRKIPHSIKNNINLYINKRFCAFDGDCDRIIYYVPINNDDVITLTGNHIIILQAFFINHLLSLSRDIHEDIKIGIIQNRYTNGGNLNFIKKLINCLNNGQKLPDVTLYFHEKIHWHHEFVNTGVKNLKPASMNYDLSIYYEDNGHGNIVVNVDEFRKKVKNDVLISYLSLFIPSSCDAIINCLANELAFKVLNITFHDIKALYNDLPSINTYVVVPKKIFNNFQSNKLNESILDKPVEISMAVTELLKETDDNLRVFVRPSGTEPICRIYIEASSQSTVDTMYNKVKYIITNYININI